MGDFIIYYRGKVVGGIYDDRLLACFLDTGKILGISAKRKATIDAGFITENTLIESNIVLSLIHI